MLHDRFCNKVIPLSYASHISYIAKLASLGQCSLTSRRTIMRRELVQNNAASSEWHSTFVLFGAIGPVAAGGSGHPSMV